MRWGLATTGLLFMLLMFAVMMAVKNDVRGMVRERQELATEKVLLTEELRVLQAEVAYLTSPFALQNYTEKLDLVQLDVRKLKRWEQQS